MGCDKVGLKVHFTDAFFNLAPILVTKYAHILAMIKSVKQFLITVKPQKGCQARKMRLVFNNH